MLKPGEAGAWVITGVGLASSAGDTPDELHAALTRGRALGALRPEDALPAVSLSTFDATRYIRRKGVKDLSRVSQLACAAASANAEGIREVPVTEVGVVLGSAWGSVATVVEFERQAHLQGPRFVDPILFTETVTNVPAGQVAILYGWSAFNATVSAGSASGTAGVHRALEFLAEGRGSVAVAGGVDELNGALLGSLAARGTIATRLDSLPLVAARGGPIASEGACFLTLESRSHAQARGAVAQGEIRAAHARFSARAGVGARPGSLAEWLRGLLEAAELPPGAIDVVVLSANGARDGDREEAAAVVEVFGAGASAPAAVVPKAVLGETWGASGPLAVVAALAMMRTATIPGAPRELLAGCEFPGLNLSSESRSARVHNVLLIDRAAAGHQMGLVISAGGRPGAAN